MKIAWCITGAEMFLNEVIELIRKIDKEKVEIFLSKSAMEILARYKILEKLEGYKINNEGNTSIFVITKLFSGRFDKIVIAPCSTNTIAKMVHGISDTLVTNIFSQGGKLRIPIYVLPSDNQEFIEFSTISGKKHLLFMREIDKENLKKLAKFEGVKIFNNVRELEAALFDQG
jgi:flavoprotein